MTRHRITIAYPIATFVASWALQIGGIYSVIRVSFVFWLRNRPLGDDYGVSL